MSLQEEEKQKALRPEPARSVGNNLDSSLSIQSQRRDMSKMPANIEELRTKYKVMVNMFLLTKMRQPSCMLCRELEVHTFSHFLDELLSDWNFLMESDDDGHLVISPWNQCLNDEFNIRNSPSKTPSGTHFRRKSTGCSTGCSSLRSPMHARTLRGCGNWNNVYRCWNNRDAVLAHHAVNRNQRAVPASMQQLALPSSVQISEEEEKAEENVTPRRTDGVRILQYPRLKVSGTFRSCSKTETIINTSSRTTAGSTSRVFARMPTAPANTHAWLREGQCSL